MVGRVERPQEVAHTFSTSGVSWVESPVLVEAPSGEDMDAFGSPVVLSGDGLVLAVGAHWEDSSATGIDGDQDNNSAGDSELYISSGAAAPPISFTSPILKPRIQRALMNLAAAFPFPKAGIRL